MNGQLATRVRKQGFESFMWRPRPDSILPKSTCLEIINNLKTYRKKYKIEERKETNEANAAANAVKREKKAEIDTIAKEGLFRYLNSLEERLSLFGIPKDALPTDFDYVIVSRTEAPVARQ
jgi:uncharacterized protein with WD repeat